LRRTNKMIMKQLRVMHLSCLVIVLLLVACRRAEDQQPPTTPMPTPTAAAARGEEDSPAGETNPNRPAATRTSAVDALAAATGTGTGFTILFEVEPDGFGFRNYGAGYPEGDFTVADLRALFGDGVCSRIEGDQCIPTAEAQQWIADRNADMSVGHCIGFTVTSYRFLAGDYQPASFTADADAPFDLPQKAPIMRTIAANGSPTIFSSTTTTSPASRPS
jgi:hypothetical protein